MLLFSDVNNAEAAAVELLTDPELAVVTGERGRHNLTGHAGQGSMVPTSTHQSFTRPALQ